MATKCNNCAGKGKLARYKHVEAGVCFSCRGTGVKALRRNGKNFIPSLHPVPIPAEVWKKGLAAMAESKMTGWTSSMVKVDGLKPFKVRYIEGPLQHKGEEVGGLHWLDRVCDTIEISETNSADVMSTLRHELGHWYQGSRKDKHGYTRGFMSKKIKKRSPERKELHATMDIEYNTNLGSDVDNVVSKALENSVKYRAPVTKSNLDAIVTDTARRRFHGASKDQAYRRLQYTAKLYDLVTRRLEREHLPMRGSGNVPLIRKNGKPWTLDVTDVYDFDVLVGMMAQIRSKLEKAVAFVEGSRIARHSLEQALKEEEASHAKTRVRLVSARAETEIYRVENERLAKKAADAEMLSSQYGSNLAAFNQRLNAKEATIEQLNQLVSTLLAQKKGLEHDLSHERGARKAVTDALDAERQQLVELQKRVKEFRFEEPLGRKATEREREAELRKQSKKQHRNPAPPANLFIMPVYEDETSQKLIDAAWNLVPKSGIRITKGKELMFIAQIGRKVVGAGFYLVDTLFNVRDAQGFDCDVIVDEKYAGKGIGEALVKELLQAYRSEKRHRDEPVLLNINVINPIMEKVLIRLGYTKHEEHRAIFFRDPADAALWEYLYAD